MTRREKMLALLIGFLLVCMGVFWVGNSVLKSFQSRDSIHARKLQELEKQDLVLKQGTAADRVIKEYETRSLPSDLELARAQYESWLAKLLAKAEIKKPKFGCKSEPKRKGDEPVTITWNVSGVGGLDQVTGMLQEYYALDTLHRMSSLKLTTIPESRDLQINFDTQAFVLANTPPETKLDPERKSDWAEKYTPDKITKILERNMLSRANKAPRLARMSKVDATVGKSVELRLKAEDPNEFDKLRYSLVESPEGARVEASSGRFVWRPEQAGEFTLVARVDDDGIPSRSATQEIFVTVVDPPPPPPEKPEPKPEPPPTVDEAMFTYVTGQVRVDGKPQIWLTVRTSGETLKLSEGDAIKIGSVDGVISKINGRSFELTVDEQDPREVRRGEPLVQMPISDTADE